MPLPRRQTVPIKTDNVDGEPADDIRFRNFETDPKFRLPSKKHTKTRLDSRFSRLQSDPDFHHKASVDRYGRRLPKNAGKNAIERLYRLEESDREEHDLGDTDSREIGHGTRSKQDNAVLQELARVEKKGFDPIRDGGLQSSSDEESSTDDEVDVEGQAELIGEELAVPTGDITSRLAAVNLDWDNIRSSDIMAVANSFVPANGRILTVKIYPSDFGIERLHREEIEGPPREIFTSSANKVSDEVLAAPSSIASSDRESEDFDADQLGLEPGEDFDSTALRTYQLDRLRYYYAIITCSSAIVAKSIYDSLDGREYLTSANFFDLRFVPDDVTFDQDFRDECEILPDGYKPNEFTTDALTHSKVKLTWDADDTTRKEVQKRAFSRKEIDENELRAYLGSDSSSSEDGDISVKADKAAGLRAALGLETTGKKTQQKQKASSRRNRDLPQPAGEMQITFTGGLTADKGSVSVFENEIPVEESTLEKYVRKERERKVRRKERAKARKEGRDPDEDVKVLTKAADDGEEEDPFNDPFFASDPEDTVKTTKVEMRKLKKADKLAERKQHEEVSAAERANLELLMIDEDGDRMKHFDMSEILKAEKAMRKGKKNGRSAPVDKVEFRINTQDPRFAKLYENHDFAIDPTNPKFKETAGMRALLEEGRKKRKHSGARLESDGSQNVKKPKRGIDESADLKKLAARIKAKSR